MIILALDYGEKRIGVALTDETGKYTRALDYIPNKSESKKIYSKNFPQGTHIDLINKARKEAKTDSKIEFKKLCNRLLYLINCYYPGKLLIGIPTIVDADGNKVEGKQAKIIHTFVRKLGTCLKQQGISMEIEFLEESMSSQMAEHNLRLQGITTTEKIKERIDSESARILLEEYILTQKTNPHPHI